MIRNLFGRIFPFFGKTCSTPHVINKGADQPGHLCQRNGHQHTTISVFTIVHMPDTHPIREGTGNAGDNMQRSDEWEQLQETADDAIPAHEFLDTSDKDQHTGDIQSHAFLDASEFVEVTSDVDLSMEIKEHPLLTESGEHVLVAPTYSPGSGSSVDPIGKYSVNEEKSIGPTVPVKPDGSGDRASGGIKAVQQGEHAEKVVVQKDQEIEVKKDEAVNDIKVEAAGSLTQSLEKAKEMTGNTDDNDKQASTISCEKESSYIGYVHHMTANKKLIKAKDLFYQLGFQKGVSKTDIEGAAISQYKLAASKQNKPWIKDARYFAEILFSGPWIEENLPMLDGRSGRKHCGNKKKSQKQLNVNEQFELPGGTCRDFRLKDNPNLETLREDAACSKVGQCSGSEKSAESLDKFVSDYTSSVIDQAIKIAISDGLSESAIMEVIEDVTAANVSYDTPQKGTKATPLDHSRTPKGRWDQLAMGFNYHSDVVVKESPKTLHGGIIPIDTAKQPREKPDQLAMGFNYHSDIIVKESPRAPSGEILNEDNPSTPRRRARDQLALGFSYHSNLLAKDAVVDHNENISQTENKNLKQTSEDSVNNVAPGKTNEIETVTPKSAKKSISDTYAVGFSYSSDLMMKESQDQLNINLNTHESENKEEVKEIGEVHDPEVEEISDLVGEIRVAGSMW